MPASTEVDAAAIDVVVLAQRLDTIEQLLVGLAARLDALHVGVADPAETARARHLSRADVEALEELLPAVAASVGSCDFIVAELFAHAEVDEQLRLAIGSAVGGKASPSRALGRLLRRAEGVAFGAIVVQRLGPVRSGVLWRVAPARV